MIDFTRVIVGAGGRPVCAECATATPVSNRPAAEVEAAIADAAQLREVPGPNVALTGPEPLDHPQILELIAACAREGAERIAVETDGVGLVPQFARRAIEAGLRHLWVVIPDAEPARGDRLAGRPGHTGRAFDGVDAFAAAAEAVGVDVVITAVIPVCRHNLQHLPETVARLSTRGFHAARLVAEGPASAQATAWIASACDTGMVNRLWVEVDGDISMPGTHRLHLTEWPARHG